MGLFGFLKKDKQKDKPKEEIFKATITNPTQGNYNYVNPLEKYKVNEIVDDSKYNDNYQYYDNFQCPNCQHQFDKEVKNKRKCPNCKEDIFPRTHYTSKKKMLLLAEDVEKHDKERNMHDDLKWAVKMAVNDLGASDSDIEKMLSATRANTKFDILWGLANKKAMEYAQNFQWGLYRNNRANMAYILNREGKIKHALQFYFIVSFFDLNGSMNAGWINNKPNLDYNPFNSDVAFIAPGIISSTKRIAKELGMNDKEIKDLFISSVEKEKNDLMSVTPEQAWKKFWKAYNENE